MLSAAKAPLDTSRLPDYDAIYVILLRWRSPVTEEDALELIRTLLKAPDEEQLMQTLSLHLPLLDSTFFGVAEASIAQLDRDGKPGAAVALRSLTDCALRLKTLI